MILIGCFSLYSLDIDTDKIDLKINFVLVPVYSIAFPTIEQLFYIDAGSIEFDGKYEKLSFNFELELSNKNDLVFSDFIKDLYLNYKFLKAFQIRFGQFKVPFGEESFLGRNERPYKDHYNSSKELCPPRSCGIMLYGKKIFDWMGYKIGLFSTPFEEWIEDNLRVMCLSGKIYYKGDLSETFSLKSGYSMYYSQDKRYAHSIFIKGDWQMSDNLLFSIFCEYLEQHYFIFYNYWHNGFMGHITCRFPDFETYVSAELFDRDIKKESVDDCFEIRTGFNYYMANDYLRIGLEYKFKNKYISKKHTLSVYCVLVL